VVDDHDGTGAACGRGRRVAGPSGDNNRPHRRHPAARTAPGIGRDASTAAAGRRSAAAPSRDHRDGQAAEARSGCRWRQASNAAAADANGMGVGIHSG
jgi:hypothetical protein